MTIYSVYDEAFRPYGRVVTGLPCEELRSAMETVPMPERGVAYEPAIPALEQCGEAFAAFRDRAFGGMPVQLGMCWGHNTRLNCLEYHRDSEFNLGTGNFILLLAGMDHVHDMMLDTAHVTAFRVPAGVLVEVYATTLHYAPQGEEAYLTACNKWLLPHPDSDEARNGAKVGLTGINIDIANDL